MSCLWIPDCPDAACAGFCLCLAAFQIVGIVPLEIQNVFPLEIQNVVPLEIQNVYRLVDAQNVANQYLRAVQVDGERLLRPLICLEHR